MRPIFDDRDIVPLGESLRGRRLDLVVSGGVASIESPRLVRELRRFGAEVRVFMTSSATKFVSPLVFEWASKNAVVTDLSGSAEHISKADAVVVAPCTLNFLAKVSLGIADSAAATLVQSALGRMPVLVAPSMHTSLSDSASFAKHHRTLSQMKNVIFLEPELSESKAKMISIEDAAAMICHFAGKPSGLRGKRVVISAGPTRSFIDDVRFLSNPSTGSLGLKIADEFYRRGAEVSLILGPSGRSVPSYLDCQSVATNQEMKLAFQRAIRKKAHIAIFSAAVLDFDVVKPSLGKLTSRSLHEFRLKPASKLIESIHQKGMLRIGFKLESRLSEKELLKRAAEALVSQKADVLVANRFEDVEENSHRAYILIKNSRKVVRVETKAEIAQALAVLCESKLEGGLSAKSSAGH